MNSNIITHNLIAMNANRMLGINAQNKAKSMEKLSSGYRVNRAADDAASLAVSEKMRRLVRGLNQGTENTKDGVSWVQTGDGALDEVHSMLHRMTELSVKALNDTLTDSDRAMMQVEFDHLQKEIDRLTDAATFNEMHIFSEHDIPYYQLEGNKKWQPSQTHMVVDGYNDLNITYTLDDGSEPRNATITVPPGEYTTKELIDEIDSAMEAAGLEDIGFSFEFKQDGTCNVNLDGGVYIDEVSGGLSYLLYDMYGGGSLGALIGTTTFDDGIKLDVQAGINDHIEFDIENLENGTQHVSLTLDTGPSGRMGYTKSDLINWLNDNLKGTSVRAVEYGQCIRLESDDSVITGLKGNMFKVDDPTKGERIFSGVFYDNIRFGNVSTYGASLRGGAVLTSNDADAEHGYYHITSGVNDTLWVQPNGSSRAIELHLLEPTETERYFTAEAMRDRLNDLFKQNGLGLEAEVYPDGEYKGLIITSTVTGIDSNVGIAPNSKAYKTLFVTRAYNVQEEGAVFDRETVNDGDAYYLGGKTFTSDNYPFTIEKDKNDKFNIVIEGESSRITYEITLEAKEYNSIDEICKAVNDAIKEAADKLPNPSMKPLLESVKAESVASGSGYKIRLTTTDSEAVRIRTAKCVGNNGYEDLFTTTVTYEEDLETSSNGRITLNQKIDFPVTVPSSKRKLTITLDGQNYTVDIEPGTYTRDKLLEVINAQLPEARTVQSPNTFGNVSDNGSGGGGSMRTGSGNVTPPSRVDYEKTGSSDVKQGQVGKFEKNEPAQISISVPSSSFPFEVTDRNNTLRITINDVERSVQLPQPKTYNNIDDLVRDLQTSLNAAFGTGFGGVDVSRSGNSIVLTARLLDNGVEQDGSMTNIKCSVSTSSFLEDLTTDSRRASITTDTLADFPITFKAGDTFKFTYTDPQKGRREVTVTLTGGSYTADRLVGEINAQLNQMGIAVTAEITNVSQPVSGYGLRLAADNKGAGYVLDYDPKDGGTITDSLYYKKSAEITLGAAMQDPIEIDASSNTFIVYVDGDKKEITLTAPKSYDPASFVQELNDRFREQKLNVTAELSGNRLVLKNTTPGAGTSISMSYSGGGTSMPKIFGYTERHYNGLEASFDANNHLVLTAVNEENKWVNNATVSVSSRTGSIFQLGTKSSTATNPGTSSPGYHSTKHATVDGATMDSEPITIDRWNNQLNFTYYYARPPVSSNSPVYPLGVTITLEDGEYTYAELQEALQNKLDDALKGAEGQIRVEVSKNGVNLTASESGNKYYFLERDFSGGFYYNVLCRTREAERETRPDIIDGGYDSSVYAVGRKDIRNNITEITKDVNDTLTLDFTYGNNPPIKLSMTLEPGKYSGSELVKHIQKKLNEQLEAAGLEKNTIEVQIGGISTGVEGNNDDNALVFKLAEHVRLPEENVEYIIDGIGGKAAFSVFYQTDGDLKVAYVTGTKNISNGVTIPEDSDFSFAVDGVSYSVSIPAGAYTANGLLDIFNRQLKDAGAPVIARNEGGYFQLMLTKYGKHEITDITGGAKRYIFFQENGQKEGSNKVWVHSGNEAGDGIFIERPRVNTVSLDINSIGISKTKYANKALDRVKAATVKVSKIRSQFGAEQNRLEHTIDRNNNTVENTQAAESAIRDTDISKEMLRMSTNSILEQAGASILAQANSSRQMLLSLLR